MESASPDLNPTDAFLTRLWLRNTPILLERLDLLDSAAAAASTETLDDTLRAAALAQAHNLAGSLGMFGYPKGTLIAREIEELLNTSPSEPSPRLAHLTKALRATLFPTP